MTEDIKYVTRPTGQRVLVTVLNSANGPKVRRRRKGTFVKVPLDVAADFSKITKTPKALVWISLLYAAWEAKGSPFVFSNEKLLGKCTREMKRRVLSELQRAGRIRVERGGKQAPRVTILSHWRDSATNPVTAV
jgi:hypothetical protein